jgi:hypothetical protein
MASPIFGALVPVLLTLSAVSFTMSYYNLYVIPKMQACTAGDCDCVSPQVKKQERISKGIFWGGLAASIFFFSYFQWQQYKSDRMSAALHKADKLRITELQTALNDTTAAEETPCCSNGGACE